MQSAIDQRTALILCCHIYLLPFKWLMRLRHWCPLMMLTYLVKAGMPTRHWIGDQFY